MPTRFDEFSRRHNNGKSVCLNKDEFSPATTLRTVFKLDGTTGAITEKNEYSFHKLTATIAEDADLDGPVRSESPTVFQDLPQK